MASRRSLREALSPFVGHRVGLVRFVVAGTLLSSFLEIAGVFVLGAIAVGASDWSQLKTLGAAGCIGGALLGSACLRYLADRSLLTSQTLLEAKLRASATDAIIVADWQRFVSKPGHEFQSAILAEAPQIAALTTSYVRGKAATGSAAIVLAAAAAASPGAALVAIAAGLAVAAFYKRLTKPLGQIQHHLATINVELTRTTSILVNGLKGLRVSPVQQQWAESTNEVARQMQAKRLESLILPLRGRFLSEVSAAALVIGILTVQVVAYNDVVPGLVALALLLRLIPRLQQAQAELSNVKHGEVWLRRWTERMVELAYVPQITEIVAGAQPPLNSDDSAGIDSVPRVTPALSVRSLWFTYAGHTKPVLQDVNLRVEQGEWVGLVGASGEGKTTLIDCLCGLLVPQEGRIEIFGEALLGLHPHRRFSEMTLVPQDVTLIGNELSSILTWQHMLTPVASLDDIIDCLGLDQMFFEGGGEVIDEMGRDTSGGMKTRLGLGRALASAPRILILDETTARLDPRTEGEILGRIRAAFPLLTVLVSSHRKETLRHVDRVVLLAAGNLSEASSNGLGA